MAQTSARHLLQSLVCEDYDERPRNIRYRYRYPYAPRRRCYNLAAPTHNTNPIVIGTPQGPGVLPGPGGIGRRL